LEELAQKIEGNARRYEQIFCEAIDKIMKEEFADVVSQSLDVFDVLHV
jgi:hypothetical protein